VGSYNGYKQLVGNQPGEFGLTVRANEKDAIARVDCSAYHGPSTCGTLFLGTTTHAGNYLIRAQQQGFVGHEGITCSLFGESKATWIVELLNNVDKAVMSLDQLKPSKASKDYTGWGPLDNVIEGCKVWFDAGGESATCLEIFYVLCHKKGISVTINIGADSKAFKGPHGSCADLFQIMSPAAQDYAQNDGISPKVFWKYLSDGSRQLDVIKINAKQPKKGVGCMGVCYSRSNKARLRRLM